MNTRIWVMALMLVGMIGLVIPMGSASLNDDLKSYYKLDETGSGAVVDELGNYDGINVGATRGVTGIINDAFDFDGSSDYVNISTAPLLTNDFRW